MSPLPALPLEVERYVGACLISNHNHQKVKQGEVFYHRERYQQHRILPRRGNEDNFRPQRCGNLDGWAGGVPLISFVNQHRNRQQNLVRSPPAAYEDLNLARLAVHTQGAPLILSKTYNHRKNKQQRNQRYQDVPNKPRTNSKCETHNTSTSADTVSVTSDESYGSTSSEQCLPRIIKPRKRRKKDRKTPVFEPTFQTSDSTEVSSDSTSPDVSNTSKLLTFEFLVPETTLESETPKLHHTFEEVEDLEDSKISSTTRCQCRVCDPAGQIWDSDKTSYSSFLTPPERKDVFTYPDLMVQELSRLTLDGVKGDGSRRASTSDLEVSSQIVTSLNGHRDLEIKFFSSTTDKMYQKLDIETC